MKFLSLAFALSAIVACVAQDDDSTSTDPSELDQAYACRTSADCPDHQVCGADAECHGPSTTIPIISCASDLQCPAHERCNPICASTGAVRHVCQPDGMPTHACPDPLP